MARWCALGAIVMLLWLLAPVASCSFDAFRDTPISEYDANKSNVSEADRDRVRKGEGFFRTLGRSVAYCYERTPLTGQESWKDTLLFCFAGAALVAFVLGRLSAPSRGSLD
jgi:hypothetical protein